MPHGQCQLTSILDQTNLQVKSSARQMSHRIFDLRSSSSPIANAAPLLLDGLRLCQISTIIWTVRGWL